MNYPYLFLNNKLSSLDNEIIQEYNRLCLFDKDFYLSLEYYQRTISPDLTLNHIICTLNRYLLSLDSEYVAVREKQWSLYYLIPYSSEIIHIRKRKGNIFGLL